MDPNTQQPQPQTPPPQPVMQAPAPMPTTQPVTAPPPVAPAPKSRKKLLLVLLIVLILLLVLGGVGYFYLMGNKSAGDQVYVPPQEKAAKVTATPTPEVSVESAAQLDGAINEVNGVSTTTMESELNQAVTEAKSL